MAVLKENMNMNPDRVQGSDPTLGAAIVAFYIVLLSISSTKDKGPP